MASEWTADSIPDLTGKVSIVTGANCGLGYEDARALTRKGATVILACRDKDKGEEALSRIGMENPEATVELMQLDLADLASIRRFADEFKSKHERLDILINNAGLMMPPFMKTEDGFELQFGTNHLGHFALTGLLLDLIIGTPKARVATVSSVGHRIGGKIDFDNLNGERGYGRQAAYAQSKLANLLFTYELQRRFEAAGVDAIAAAAHPGLSLTSLGRYGPRWVDKLVSFFSQKPEMGALPALYAATASGVQGGDYYGPRGFTERTGYPTRVRSSKRSHDMTVAARLWTVSEELTGVRYHQLGLH